MPIYEYRCVDCGHEFEEIRPISDPDPKGCPDCEGAEVNRLVSQSNFALKGGGWFDDGYGASSNASDADSGASSSDTTTDSEPPPESTSTETKEEAAAE